MKKSMNVTSKKATAPRTVGEFLNAKKATATKEDRMQKMQAAGVDTSKYYNINVSQTLPAGSTIKVSVHPVPFSVPNIGDTTLPVSNSLAPVVFQSGYVLNSKTHRRWIMAQTMQMLSNPKGWSASLHKHPYMYTLEMLTEEVRVISKLESRDKEAFEERASFFSLGVVRGTMIDYVEKLRKYVESLPVQKCKDVPYVHISCFGNVYLTDLERTIFQPFVVLLNRLYRANTYAEVYRILKAVRWVFLPKTTVKNSEWIDAFKGSGAYFTLKNMIMYHGVMLPGTSNTYESMFFLNEYRQTKKGFQILGLLKDTIELTHFNFEKSIAIHSK